MTTVRRASHSAPHITRGMNKARLSIEFQKAQQRARSESFQEAYEKIPQMGLKKVFDKMGIISRTEALKNMPSQSDRKAHRMSKYIELKKKFYLRKRFLDKRPFESQDFDEVVLDVYKPGKKRSNSEVWNIYKDNYKSLTYQTQKVLNQKGIFCPR